MVGAIEIPLMGRLKAQTTRTKTSVLAMFWSTNAKFESKPKPHVPFFGLNYYFLLSSPPPIFMMAP